MCECVGTAGTYDTGAGRPTSCVHDMLQAESVKTLTLVETRHHTVVWCGVVWVTHTCMYELGAEAPVR